jgi:hypothetical protein
LINRLIDDHRLENEFSMMATSKRYGGKI